MRTNALRTACTALALATLLLAAACGMVPAGGSSSGGGGDSQPPQPTRNQYNTVTGRIVQRSGGRPYPNAYVRFGWLENAVYEKETDTRTRTDGTYVVQLPAGQYQVSAGDDCDLNAGFDIVGPRRDDAMITVPGDSQVDFVEYPITPEAETRGDC